MDALPPVGDRREAGPAFISRPRPGRPENYQIEYRLFPSMPRLSLRRFQALVTAFCRQQGVPYCQSSLASSYAQALRHLNTIGGPGSAGRAAGQ